MKQLLKELTIKYDVMTYQITQKVIKAGGVHYQSLVWDIPTIEQARLILDQIYITDAKIHKEVEYYYNDRESQEGRLSTLANTGIMACIELEPSTSTEFSGVGQ